MADIQTKSLEPLNVMSLPFTGAYDQTGARLDDLLAWILRAGHPWSGPPAGVFYDDPDKVAEDELRAEVVVPLDETCEGDDRVARKTLPGAEVACLTYEGPMSGIGQAYEELFNWIHANGWTYVEALGTREVYVRLPEEHEEGEEPKGFMVELQVPIEKATAAEPAPVEPEPVEPGPAEPEPEETT